MTRTIKLIIALFVLSFMGCAPSTMMENTWVEPSVKETGIKPFQKLMVVAFLKDESTRRIAEDKMVKAIKTPSIASYTLISGPNVSKEEIQDKLNEGGFDGMVIMRLAEIERSASYVPGPYAYGGWYGYYGYAAPMYYSPGYYVTDKIYYVETMIYSLEPDKLLWSGITSSTNPGSSTIMIDDIILVVKDNLKRNKLVK